MIEIWKEIEGYEGLYEVSNLGRVKSLGNNKSRKEKVLKPGNNGRGYIQVYLHKNGQKEKLFVHRLVAQAFIPNTQNLPEVNHKDEDKTNNCVDNLEWVSSRENTNYGTRNLRVAEKLTNGICSKPVLQFALDGTFVCEWPSLSEIWRQLKFNLGNICQCCLGNRKSAHGFIWKYS